MHACRKKHGNMLVRMKVIKMLKLSNKHSVCYFLLKEGFRFQVLLGGQVPCVGCSVIDFTRYFH